MGPGSLPSQSEIRPSGRRSVGCPGDHSEVSDSRKVRQTRGARHRRTTTQATARQEMYDVSECPMPEHSKEATTTVSESENPEIPSPTPTTTRPRTNRDWWPNQLDLSVLHANPTRADPMGPDFDYGEYFRTQHLKALRRNIVEVLTTHQDWWPSDHGHYG